MGKLSIGAAEKQIWRAVDELEEAINTFNNTPGMRDEKRRKDLASTLMSLLAQKYGITPVKPRRRKGLNSE